MAVRRQLMLYFAYDCTFNTTGETLSSNTVQSGHSVRNRYKSVVSVLFVTCLGTTSKLRNYSRVITMASTNPGSSTITGALPLDISIDTRKPKRVDLKEKMKSMARRSRTERTSSKAPQSSVSNEFDPLDVSDLHQSHSTFGEEDPEDMAANFMRGLEETLMQQDDSSDESSYWSSSDEDDSDEDYDSEDGGDETTSGPELSSDGDAGLTTETEESANVNRRAGPNGGGFRKAKRNDSTLSLDALLKVQMQLGDAKKPPPKDREARRRGRRLNKDHTVTSLGALARKVGSSTGNDDMKEAVLGFRRTESASAIPTQKPKKFVHVQQVGSIQGAKAPPIRSTSLVNQNSNTTMTMRNSGFAQQRKTAKYGEEVAGVKPRDHFLSILKNAGITAPLVRYEELVDFFLPITAEDKAAFDMELVGAVRDQNLTKLQQLYSEGHPMQARSQFGESLIHICARRGTPEMLRFLLSLKGGDGADDPGVSCRVCCDYGRTPLHDAAWSTHAVSLEMMKILINDCPDLLLVLDKRGFMPLDYIPKTRWEQCCAWLDKHKTMLMPTGVLFGDSSDSESEEEESDSEEEDSDYETD